MTTLVRVERLTPDWADALAEGDDVFAARFGIEVEPGWLDFPDALPALVAAAHAGMAPEWGTHVFFDGSDGALVGTGGWKGPPVDGVAELGYSVAPARRGRGIATAVVRELVERARRAGAHTVVAHTLAEPSASTAVLERCGFTEVAEILDPHDGRVWRWELTVAHDC